MTRLNEHLELEENGAIVFKHACVLGCEGIESKRLGSRYRAGRCRDWLKFKNPNAPGREARGGGGLGLNIAMIFSNGYFFPLKADCIVPVLHVCSLV